jgi:hypothetical protein
MSVMFLFTPLIPLYLLNAAALLVAFFWPGHTKTRVGKRPTGPVGVLRHPGPGGVGPSR